MEKFDKLSLDDDKLQRALEQYKKQIEDEAQKDFKEKLSKLKNEAEVRIKKIEEEAKEKIAKREQAEKEAEVRIKKIEEEAKEKIAKSEQETADLKQTAGFGKIITKGFPPLGSYNFSAPSSQHSATGHKTPSVAEVVFVERPFGIIEGLRCKDQESFIWMLAKAGKLPNWQCETRIQSFVLDSLQDIFALAKVDSVLDIYLEANISGPARSLRADITTIRKLSGELTCVCEVKKPSIRGGDLDSPSLRTQISNRA
jgi:hypothetical protein